MKINAGKILQVVGIVSDFVPVLAAGLTTIQTIVDAVKAGRVVVHHDSTGDIIPAEQVAAAFDAAIAAAGLDRDQAIDRLHRRHEHDQPPAGGNGD